MKMPTEIFAIYQVMILTKEFSGILQGAEPERKKRGFMLPDNGGEMERGYVKD